MRVGASHLECSICGLHLSLAEPQTVCPKDSGSLYVRYDLNSIRAAVTRESLAGRKPTMWRYKELLPIDQPITLDEGYTPILTSATSPNLLIKDESRNPTGSFKARGLSVGITMARYYGLTKLALPSAGNAASALAAYSAIAGIEAHIFMPSDAQAANLIESRAYGAHVTLVDGPVSVCANVVQQRMCAEGWFDISSLREPFRLEGKKTMGYEIAEQLNWQLPDAIFFPTGGGVSIAAIWKAFDELEQLGWIGSKKPRMICVQAAGCAPIVRAWEDGKSRSDPWTNPRTMASGLRVPSPYGDYLVLEVLRKSNGVAIAVSELEIIKAMSDIPSTWGTLPSPEGAACFAAYKTLLNQGVIYETNKVVIFNTATGLKYLNHFPASSQ